jgi:tetratricopeptide (TPR) repeat protein
LKKETIIAALVFLGVGFLCGYIYNAQRNLSLPSEPAQGRGADQPTESPASAVLAPNRAANSGALPAGHPPLDAATTIKFLEHQAALDASDPAPRLRLANFLFDQKRFEQAIPWYLKGLELDPGNVDARTDLGTAYYSLGRVDEAMREYHKSLELDPHHQPTLYNMVLLNLEGAHNLVAARAAWEQLHRLNPKYPGLDTLKQSLEAAQ